MGQGAILCRSHLSLLTAVFIALDPNTNTLYLVASAWSLCLSLLLLGLVRLQPTSIVLRRSVLAILLLSVGLLISGYGPLLPRWATVVAANLMLLSVGAIFASGVADFLELHPGRPERFAWSVVALTVLPFCYWGLIDSVGNYRSAVFSFALAAIGLRITYMMAREGWQQARSPVYQVTAVLFGLTAVATTARGVMALVVQAPSGNLRSVNPTAWTTVAAYMLLMSAITYCVMWIGLGQTQPERRNTLNRAKAAFTFVGYFRNKLLLLWSMVLVLVLTIVGQASLFYTESFQSEKERLRQTVELRNDVLVKHTLQVMAQVDTILHSARNFYLHTHSVDETERFIDSLPFDRSIIDNVYLITEQGKIVITHDPSQTDLIVADRDYFTFHQLTPRDQVFIGTVESGRVTGKLHFRVTRRINHADGSFAGVVLVTVNPKAFSGYYQQLAGGLQNSATLIGTIDQKIRARVPEPASDYWQVPLVSVLWEALRRAPAGNYQSTSPVDGIERVFSYRKVGELPLVMVTGFSESDIRAGVYERLRWLVFGTVTVLVIILLLASLLTIQIRRRNEQNRFMAMLSHELKSPLAVISLSLGTQSIPLEVKQRVARATAAMNGILERCLQSDQVEHQQVSLLPVPCRISEVLLELVTNCAFPQRVLLAVDDLPLCKTDVQMLEVALGNLIDNALKYGAPDSPVDVRATAAKRGLRKGICIAVANSPGASGFPDPRQVFRKYYRAAGAHGKSGSGLGLHIAHGCARNLGGALRYRPTTESVRFELWLPL